MQRVIKSSGFDQKQVKDKPRRHDGKPGIIWEISVPDDQPGHHCPEQNDDCRKDAPQHERYSAANTLGL
jgi:hypothetical protein